MKTITDDIEGFFDNGGWSFLDPESDVENAEAVRHILLIVTNHLTLDSVTTLISAIWEKNYLVYVKETVS